ncbi:MAG: LuxR C-terminal-related transcriptional regulator [Candidatus Dormibacteraeota bacterium]|nr:LuxR C-terminal-related transcriptional regulator [Candidatus Dormibacteraeota bacterium]
MRHRGTKLAEADSAAGGGDWVKARGIYSALVDSDLKPPGQLLERLAGSEQRLGAFMDSCRTLERAYGAFVDEGDNLSAVRATTRIAGIRMMFGDRPGGMAWEKRGWHHLAGVGPCVERGYHAVAFVGCDVHDPRSLLKQADLALGIAQEFQDRELELRALGDKGLALVCQGQVDEGFALLDEVMVGITAGEIADAQMRGVTLCALISACERAGDHDRAEQWGRTIEENPRLQEMGIQVTHCQIAYGALDAMRGRMDSAEARLLEAMEARATTRYHSASSRAKLAELRIRQGRYDDAAELLQGYEDEFEAAQALASLSVALGDHGRGAALLRAYTRGLGTDLMRLGPALALLVELELRRGDLAAAARAAQRLVALEGACNSNEIRALARLASARIAIHRGDGPRAIEELETALTLLLHRDRPLLTAHIRLELARALARSGEKAAAAVEAEAALATFHRLAVAPDINAGEDFMAGLGSDAGGHASDRGEGAPGLSTGGGETLTRRETEVARLVADGLTNRQIAERLHLSVRTVEAHVDRVLGKLDFHTRSRLAAWLGRGELSKVT